ncbi:(d)CMP kinase [soil metagenome]
MTVVAIDGPAGAGKSTIGRAVARALGWTFVDTGAMYRSVALAALEGGLNLDDGAALGRLASSLEMDADAHATIVNGVDVSERIRTADVTRAVSRVSAHAAVREVLSHRQREVASGGNVVMEGRDIGSAVVPGADVKVFLTATSRERALRRSRQLGLSQDDAALRDLEASLTARDSADARRAVSPFVRAPDALVIDSTGMDLDGVVRRIVDAVRSAGHAT